MNSNRDELDRLLAGDVAGDPGAEAVSEFLTGLDQAYPPPSVAALQERHLALVAATVEQEAAAGRAARSARAARRRVRRSVATVVTAVLGVLTAGIGVATALGANPLPALLPGLVAPRTAVPTAPPGPAQRDDSEPGRPGPAVPPGRTGDPGRPETLPPVSLPTQATGPQGQPGKSDNGKAKGPDNGKAKGPDNGKAKGPDNGKAKGSDNGKAKNRPADPGPPGGGPTSGSGE